jgi:hypothetical protein
MSTYAGWSTGTGRGGLPSPLCGTGEGKQTQDPGDPFTTSALVYPPACTVPEVWVLWPSGVWRGWMGWGGGGIVKIVPNLALAPPRPEETG